MYTKTNMEGHGMHKVTTGKHLRKHLSINIRTSFWQSRQIQLFYFDI
jgi:hypothetical protein